MCSFAELSWSSFVNFFNPKSESPQGKGELYQALQKKDEEIQKTKMAYSHEHRPQKKMQEKMQLDRLEKERVELLKKINAEEKSALKSSSSKQINSSSSSASTPPPKETINADGSKFIPDAAPQKYLIYHDTLIVHDTIFLQDPRFTCPQATSENSDSTLGEVPEGLRQH